MGRVRIGTCSGPADVALVRAAFDAHGIHIAINAEMHASVLGGLGGAFVPLHIMVDEGDAEEAAALLADLRDHDHGAQAGDHPEGAPEDADAPDAVPSAVDADEDDSGRAEDVGERITRRRRTGIVLLLGVCVTMGTAHMSTGAWFRGIFLAGVEAYAFTLIVADVPLGWLLFFGAIATDVIGAMWRVRRQTTQLPIARVHR